MTVIVASHQTNSVVVDLTVAKSDMAILAPSVVQVVLVVVVVSVPALVPTLAVLTILAEAVLAHHVEVVVLLAYFDKVVVLA